MLAHDEGGSGGTAESHRSGEGKLAVINSVGSHCWNYDRAFEHSEWNFSAFDIPYQLFPCQVHFAAVLKHAIEIFERKFHYFVQTIEGMDQLFEVTFSPLASSGKPLSRCGKCKRFMKYVDAKPHRLHCATCNDTYSLPPVRGLLERCFKDLL